MKYVPNLIPERYRIEIKNQDPQPKKPRYHDFLYWLSMVAGILILGLGLFYIMRPYVSVPLMIAGLSIFPFSHRYIEKVLRFKFTPALKAIFISIVMLLSFQLAFMSASQQRKGEEHLRVQREKEAKIKKQEDEFVSLYPYITRESYRKWRDIARDSVTDPNLKKHSFVAREKEQRRIRDSLWAIEHNKK